MKYLNVVLIALVLATSSASADESKSTIVKTGRTAAYVVTTPFCQLGYQFLVVTQHSSAEHVIGVSTVQVFQESSTTSRAPPQPMVCRVD